jgi:hypothetical protein
MEPSQSLLLTKLPPELRLIIWDYAFDAATLHFECVDSRMQCVWCDDTNDTTKLGFRHTCWNARRFISRAGILSKSGSRSIAIDSPAAQGQGRGRLSLLLTCKTLYVQDKCLGCECERERERHQTLTGATYSYHEALDMLYQRTTFSARRTHAIRELPRMLSATWHRVRALQLSTAFQYPGATTTTQSHLRLPLDHFAQWGQTCRVLASLNLSSLDITLALWPLNPSRRDTPIPIDSLALLLDPLRTVHADQFTVTVTSNVPPDAKGELPPEFPFELQVRDRSGIGFYTVPSDD